MEMTLNKEHHHWRVQVQQLKGNFKIIRDVDENRRIHRYRTERKLNGIGYLFRPDHDWKIVKYRRKIASFHG